MLSDFLCPWFRRGAHCKVRSGTLDKRGESGIVTQAIEVRVGLGRDEVRARAQQGRC
jgi:hypothetical protein